MNQLRLTISQAFFSYFSFKLVSERINLTLSLCHCLVIPSCSLLSTVTFSLQQALGCVLLVDLYPLMLTTTFFVKMHKIQSVAPSDREPIQSQSKLLLMCNLFLWLSQICQGMCHPVFIEMNTAIVSLVDLVVLVSNFFSLWC